jgi:hypothetical protein
MTQEFSLPPFDASQLYRVDTFGDGSCDIRMRVPLSVVVVEGRHAVVEDTSRPYEFWSTVNVSFGMQQVPVRFKIPASNLAEAMAGMSAAGEEAVRAMLAELETQRTRAALLHGGGASPRPQ